MRTFIILSPFGYSMKGTIPLHVTNHYRRNKSDYNEISARLDKTRQTFMDADTSEQIRMLQQSHSFAVISVQTPVDIHEDSFVKLWDNDTPFANLDDALSSVNYRNNKADYITHSLTHGHLWANVVDMIEAGNIDEAHKYVLDNFKGVGPAKAPFTLAMLGFTSKACIDANVINAMGLEEHVSTVVVEKYDSIVESLREKTPTLKEKLSPFMWQWVVFSWQRQGVSGSPDMHDAWFSQIGTL
jgi:thermostable 8-oxoguanine DNA glycosylase